MQNCFAVENIFIIFALTNNVRRKPYFKCNAQLSGFLPLLLLPRLR